MTVSLDDAHPMAHAWATSGLASLSGPSSGGDPGPPARLLPGVASLGQRVERASAALGRTVSRDWLGLLGERARLDGLSAGGRISCGGSCRLLPCADGWIAVSLARPTDRDLVPVWLAIAGGHPIDCRGDALAAAAALVGLPVGVLGEASGFPNGGVAVERFGPARPIRSVRVLDLSALWAGPLCGALLADAGARVLKVESTARPDATRFGSPAHFERLNGAKERRALDLGLAPGRAELARLVRQADVVIESSRPRALEQMGLLAANELARPDGPQVWVSITGHGRAAGRVAFGDDAAVAGGLVVTDHRGPWFCGDAIADPLSGLTAAAATLELLTGGDRALVDVAMAGVAAAHAGPNLPAP